MLGLLASSFVFWHRTMASPQGQAFARLYAEQGDRLPLVAVVGPTGAIVLKQCVPSPSQPPAAAHPSF